MDTTEARVERLERSVRRWRVTVIAALSILALAAWDRDDIVDVVRAHKVEIYASGAPYPSVYLSATVGTGGTVLVTDQLGLIANGAKSVLQGGGLSVYSGDVSAKRAIFTTEGAAVLNGSNILSHWP